MEVISDELDVFFGDKRIDKRAKKILETLYEGIGNGMSASFGGSSEIKAAYRFFDNDLVNPDKILKGHYKKTIERIGKHKIVGLIQDTTDIDMKHMEQVENLGVLNDTERPGCSLHPVIAFTPDKLCLGVVSAKFMIRPPKELGKKGSNNSREIEDKESYRWIEGYQVACKIAEQCPETLCVSIGDRESDIFELLLESTTGRAELLVRAWHNRCVSAPQSEKSLNLLEENKKFSEENHHLALANRRLRQRKDSISLLKENSARIIENKKIINLNIKAIKEDESIVNNFLYQIKQGTIVGTIEFKLPEGRGKKSRLVKQTVRVAKVTLKPSKHKRNLPEISINAVLLEEIDPPKDEEAISWMFLTTLPINTIEEIQLIITLYLSRWGIELFFRLLKSGCKIEELRFREASRLLSCVSIYMIIGWRVLYSVFIGRACPELSCGILFELDEWQSVYAVVKKSQPPENPPNLDEFMSMIATLGGYRGRKSDGPPGMKVVWIGIQAMHKLAEGWKAFRDFSRK
jgi:transposase Tn5 family protein/transposase-like protein